MPAKRSIALVYVGSPLWILCMYAVSLTAYIHWVTVGLLVSPLIAYAYEVEHGRKKPRVACTVAVKRGDARNSDATR